MTVAELIASTQTLAVAGPTGAEVADVCADSREAGPGSVFIAVRGTRGDGHDFIPMAAASGAVAVVAEELPREDVPGVAWIKVADSRAAFADMAAAWFGHPSRDMGVAGVTGTNGKTTTAFLIHHLMSCVWVRAGLVGTVHYHDGIEVRPASHTTPDPRALHALFARMRDNGCRGVAMEVSSHALSQKRAQGVAFEVGVFTNLTQDHLDYHGDMDAYFEAKVLLFDQMAASQARHQPTAVINTDDKWGRRLHDRFKDRLRCVTFGMGVGSEFRAGTPRSDFHGTRFELEAKGRSFLVRSPLIGSFNVYNALAALAAGTGLGLNLREAVGNLASAPQVPGRLEAVAAHRPFQVFVDYAHTPDALENVLATVRELHPKRLITVFGCGGDRDRSKRPLMGGVVSRLSDACILTSDNPRSEDPLNIIADVERGIGTGRHLTVPDRAAAIARAIEAARPGDIIVIAGKGHEDYQELATGRIPFDDRRIARRCIDQWNADREADRSGPTQTTPAR